MGANDAGHFCPVGDRRRPVAVLFDLDDTLLDHAHAVECALQEFHAAHAGEIAHGSDEFRRRWKSASTKHWDRFASGEIGWAQQGRMRVRGSFGRPDLEEAAADSLFAQYVEAYESHWTLFPDVLPCLESLRGRPLGIVTNGDPKQQRRKLRRLGLREHFKEILISGELGTSKPSPEIFLEASRRLWCIPGECVMVGDSWDRDVEGGLRAGMQPVWLARSGGAHRPGVPVVTGLDEIPRLVEGWQTAKPEEVPALDFVI